MLRRVKVRNGHILTNLCGIYLERGPPMVGSRYCKDECPYCKGVISILGLEFIKCNKYGKFC